MIASLEGIYNELSNFDGDERDFNKHLLNLTLSRGMKLDLFLEYLEVTQGDIADCLRECLD
jgi:hypothetical protein